MKFFDFPTEPAIVGDSRFSALSPAYKFFHLNMTSTTYSRKLDSQGRIMIPIRLREEFGLASGVEYQFFIHEDENARYICIECPITKSNDLTIEKAKELLESQGYKLSPGR